MKHALIPAALLLAACGASATGNAAGNEANTSAAAPAAPAAAPAKAFEAEEKTDLLEWSLSYPAEAAAIPKLAAMIKAASDKDKAENLAAAKSDKAQRAKDDFPFNAYEQSDGWETYGATDQLLSLADNWYVFTGGAHPNHGTKALLWDKAADGPIDFASLLEGGAARLAALYRDSYCKELTVERSKRREGEDADNDPNDPFNVCPKFSELVIMPESPEGGGPMTKIMFHADPYVAGPYVEGDYDIELPVTAAFIAALKPAYRSSFAVPR